MILHEALFNQSDMWFKGQHLNPTTSIIRIEWPRSSKNASLIYCKCYTGCPLGFIYRSQEAQTTGFRWAAKDWDAEHTILTARKRRRQHCTVNTRDHWKCLSMLTWVELMPTGQYSKGCHYWPRDQLRPANTLNLKDTFFINSFYMETWTPKLVTPIYCSIYLSRICGSVSYQPWLYCGFSKVIFNQLNLTELSSLLPLFPPGTQTLLPPAVVGCHQSGPAHGRVSDIGHSL